MTLGELNNLDEAARAEALEKCCGSSTWVQGMMRKFPFGSTEKLIREAEDVWRSCHVEDWKQAFTHHPKIGDLDSLKKRFASTSKWASGEQSAVKAAGAETLIKLQKGNEAYQEKFGYIFIVCATGKSAEEMLFLLEERLPNVPEEEIRIAMEEQLKITVLRLQKLLL